MLRPGFLQTLSDAVMGHIAAHADELDHAAEEFGFDTRMARNANPETVAALFFRMAGI